MTAVIFTLVPLAILAIGLCSGRLCRTLDREDAMLERENGDVDFDLD